MHQRREDGSPPTSGGSAGPCQPTMGIGIHRVSRSCPALVRELTPPRQNRGGEGKPSRVLRQPLGVDAGKVVGAEKISVRV